MLCCAFSACRAVQKNLLHYLHSFHHWPNLCKHKQAKHKIKLCKHSALVDGCSLLLVTVVVVEAKGDLNWKGYFSCGFGACR